MGRNSRKDERQKEILEAFYQTVKDQGIENASMARIAKIMDVNPSLIIHYFPNKEAMVIAMVDSIIEQYQGDFLPLIQQIQDPTDRIRLLIYGIFSLEWIQKVDNGVFYSFYACCFHRPNIRLKFQDMYSVFRGILVEELTLAQDAKVILPEIDPNAFADFLITTQEGNTYYQGLMKGEIQGKQVAEFHIQLIYKLLGLE